MPTKIGFEVVSNSGEDENFPASDLNRHGFCMRGWRSPANTLFPHYLTIKLETLALLHQIQLLAHQYLIPEKVEISTSSNWDEEDFKTEFEYLGFITFSDNKASEFRSRELKSIFVPAIQAKYIKFVIPSNHVNVKNIYNQVFPYFDEISEDFIFYVRFLTNSHTHNSSSIRVIKFDKSQTESMENDLIHSKDT